MVEELDLGFDTADGYTSYSTGTNKNIDTVSSGILNDNVKKVSEDTENLICPQCGAKNHKGYKFCKKCGNPLAANKKSNGYEKKFCTRCGSQTDASSVFCPKCGNKMMEGDYLGCVPKDYHKGFLWSPGRIIALVSIILTLMASFLPFMTVTGYNVSLWNKNFIWLTLIGVLILLIAILELVRNSKNLSKDMIAVGIVFAIEIIFQYIFNLERLSDFDTGYGNYDFSGLLSPGVGFYMLILSSIGMIISGFVIKCDNENV